ncbi:hypothetical protein [Mesomycoplasma lagogenitalium]|uniref:Uncharacterized protein n=1 Tax=Mesomycoplasma lagogenitalium TaxID=171286 RepID=A0ABY8LTE6_9BACT|nr:hypothetical protein [Mesomycoplasma lagogenitalium]WGI36516.1 hypothetical protein QEG99_03560 [Mesomycoplasma lagogenitalium]
MEDILQQQTVKNNIKSAVYYQFFNYLEDKKDLKTVYWDFYDNSPIKSVKYYKARIENLTSYFNYKKSKTVFLNKEKIFVNFYQITKKLSGIDFVKNISNYSIKNWSYKNDCYKKLLNSMKLKQSWDKWEISSFSEHLTLFLTWKQSLLKQKYIDKIKEFITLAKLEDEDKSFIKKQKNWLVEKIKHYMIENNLYDKVLDFDKWRFYNDNKLSYWTVEEIKEILYQHKLEGANYIHKHTDYNDYGIGFTSSNLNYNAKKFLTKTLYKLIDKNDDVQYISLIDRITEEDEYYLMWNVIETKLILYNYIEENSNNLLQEHIQKLKQIIEESEDELNEDENLLKF